MIGFLVNSVIQRLSGNINADNIGIPAMILVVCIISLVLNLKYPKFMENNS